MEQPNNRLLFNLVTSGNVERQFSNDSGKSVHSVKTLRGVKKTFMTQPNHQTTGYNQNKPVDEMTDPAEKLMLVSKGLPPFSKWALSANENYREETLIWPCNDYTRRSESAQVTLRPKLNRKINAMSYADKRGQGVYYNALGSNRKIHRKQVDLILPRQDIEFQLERADWFQFFRGEMSMKLEKQYLHDNHIREKGLERFKSHITVPEAKINPVC